MSSSSSSSSLRKRVIRDDDMCGVETRSVSKKRKQVQLYNMYNVITPVHTLIFPYFTDQDAFAFFRTNHYFISMIPSYPLKSVFEIRTISSTTMTVYTTQRRLRERDERGARIIKGWDDHDNNYIDPRWFKFPFSLLNQIQTLVVSYRKISQFLNQLRYEGSGRSLLKHIEFTDSIYMKSARKSLMSLPPDLLTLDCSGWIHRVYIKSFFNIANLKSVYPHLHTLILPLNFNQPIAPGDLPDSLHTLVFNSDYTPPFVPLALPSALVRLEFFGSLKQLSVQEEEKEASQEKEKEKARILPDSLQCLFLSEGFNHSLPFLLPCSLIQLHLGESFNQIIPKDVLPEGLKDLEFGHRFNQVLPRLPLSLRSLVLRGDYNKALRNKGGLNNGLKKLELSHRFNHPLNASLPSSLQELIFGHAFNQRLHPGNLPKELKRLHFGHEFNHFLTCENLPPSLTCLSFKHNSNFQHPLPPASAFPHLTCLILPDNYNYSALKKLREESISDSLQAVVMGKDYARSFENMFGNNHSIVHLPAETGGTSKLCSICFQKMFYSVQRRIEIQRGR
jgi:FNIP Repeat